MAEMGNGSSQKKEGSAACRECEHYKFAVTEMRRMYVFKTLRYLAALAFAAVMAIAFRSYIPCALSLERALAGRTRKKQTHTERTRLLFQYSGYSSRKKGYSGKVQKGLKAFPALRRCILAGGRLSGKASGLTNNPLCQMHDLCTAP